MAEDDGLLLNLCSSSERYNEVHRERKDRKSKNETERYYVTRNGILPPRQTKKKFQVVSSLFNYNPDIPTLPASNESSGAEGKPSENVFSAEKFSDLDISPFMISNLENNLKLTTMTSVQKVAIPSLIEGRDVFVKSKTGTGKTLTYAVPVIHSLQNITPKISRSDGPYAVILVPTRELAIQSFNVLQRLVKPFQWVVPGVVMGGEKRKSEKARLRKGVNVLVATPGRLLDHIEKTKSLELKRVQWIILDEADRLLDLGFEKDVSSILTAVKNSLHSGVRCQTVLLSATLSEGVERLVGISLHNPLSVDVTTEDGGCEKKEATNAQSSSEASFTTPQQLKQFFIIVPSKLRLVTLAAFLLMKNQPEERTSVFKSFSDATRGIMFCTGSLFSSKADIPKGPVSINIVLKRTTTTPDEDVAARGLDLPHVNWIVQYNTPGNPADYVHRVGRTARIGLKGNALLFLTPAEVEYLDILKQHGIRFVHRDSNQRL
ncbi:putative ATP-dependent RNA helicase DDX31 [Stylophora pistillata]|uniref:ATP-dependent RNA helicase n=1 Tax=Stylophora pistillata TaxID=50429 RepID=A0A2B4SWU0_STYPI|nr:putative ATP-dependent RNA helicase DDX31 [Stylophora pistillata]